MLNERTRQQNTFPFLLLSAIAVIVYILLLWLLSKPLTGELSLGRADEKGLLAALKHDSGNAAYHYLLGRYYQLSINSPDTTKAIAHYQESIRRSPLQAGVWIDLSKAYRTNGQAAESEHSLERAVKLSPNNPDLMWEAGTYWLINNEQDKAVDALKRYILLEPSRQNVVYDLCWRLQIGNSYILKNLLPDSYEYRAQYLSYLISTQHPAEAEEAWKTIDINSLDKDLFIKYVNFLIASGLYDDAWMIWKTATDRMEEIEQHDETSLVWDPGFELEMLNGGFGWTIRETEGVNVFIDYSIHMSGKRSIGVSFDGRHNPDITIAQQVIRTNPSSKYSLRGYVKTASLTTTNGIFLNVLGHNCSGLNKRSEVVSGTSFWKELAVDFDTPADCRAITIAIRREKSDKFDNKIEGTAWIDAITVKQQYILQTSSSVKH
jgi:tetratricopeptide (TPR) repeat protein